jgi:hypothetical protein
MGGAKELIIRLDQSSQSWSWDFAWKYSPLSIIIPYFPQSVKKCGAISQEADRPEKGGK